MIVVDTNVLLPLFVPGEKTLLVEKVAEFDPHWIAPPICRSEFLYVFVHELKGGRVAPTAITDTLASFTRRIQIVPPAAIDEIVRISLKSGCATYDCEFVAVAESLGVRVATFDQAVYERFPSVAFHPERLLQLDKK